MGLNCAKRRQAAENQTGWWAMLDSNQRPLRCETTSTTLTLADSTMIILTNLLIRWAIMLTFVAVVSQHKHLDLLSFADMVLTRKPAT
jgi:hypothetical protein